MFDWLFSEAHAGSAGLEKMRTDFGEMLDAGRHVFDDAAKAFLCEIDPEAIREDLFATDKRINKAERQIRREIVVHSSVHGATEFPACLVLMSVVKDAERVGDYGKNLFDLAKLAPEPPSGEHHQCLSELRDGILRLMATCHEIFDSREVGPAKQLIVEAREVEDLCDEKICAFVRDGGDRMAPTYVLAYRYYKRIISHIRNIASSVVQPVHKLDFTSKITIDDEDTEPAE